MKLFLLIYVLFISTLASANSVAYITDQVDIPLRSEKTFDDNILRSLSSGTELEVIQATEDGWTQIRVDGITGWIISRYLTNIKPAKNKLTN